MTMLLVVTARRSSIRLFKFATSQSRRACFSISFLSAAFAVLLLALPGWSQSSEVTLGGILSFPSRIATEWPSRVAVDSSGNLFIADFAHNLVLEQPAGGGAPINLPISGLNGPGGIVVDGEGNIYVGDFYNGRVVEILSSGGQTTVTSGLGTTGIELTLDAAGDLFISDYGNNRVLELPPGGKLSVLPIDGLNGPRGIAFDKNGNLYIADSQNNRVIEVAWNGTSFGTQTVVGSGLKDPSSVVVDKHGNLYIADDGNYRVVVQPPGGIEALVANFSVFNPYCETDSPAGLGVDSAGNVVSAM